jgi:hypothetical protein
MSWLQMAWLYMAAGLGGLDGFRRAYGEREISQFIVPNKMHTHTYFYLHNTKPML